MRGLATARCRLLFRTTHRLAISRNLFEFQSRRHIRNPLQEAVVKLLGADGRKNAVERVVRGDAIGQLKAKPLPKPDLFGSGEFLNKNEVMGTSDRPTHDDQDDAHEFVLTLP